MWKLVQPGSRLTLDRGQAGGIRAVLDLYLEGTLRLKFLDSAIPQQAGEHRP